MKVKQLILGPSIIQTYLSCRMKFMYELFAPDRPEVPLDPMNSNADWGTVFHKLCADRDNGLPFTPSGFPDIDRRFHEYTAHTADDTFDVVGVEVPLLRQFSPVVWMGGTADKIIRPCTILDYKTSGAVTEVGGIGNRDGDQLVHYLWANGCDDGGWGIIDQISQAKLAPPSKGIKFARVSREITAADIADWKLRMEAVTSEMVATIESGTAHLYKNKKTCTDFFKLCYHKQNCDARIHDVNIRNLTDSHFSITLGD